MMASKGANPRALWQPSVSSGGPVSRDISGASRRMDEGNENLFYASPWIDYRLVAVMGETAVSALQPWAFCTIPR
jgi:hypothetical protein